MENKMNTTSTVKQRLTLATMTKDQAIEIAKLAFPFPELVKSEYEFRYHEHREDLDYSDAYEAVEVRFQSSHSSKGECFLTIFSIYPGWNVYLTTYPDGSLKPKSCPVRNQRAIQERFTEWGAETVNKKQPLTLADITDQQAIDLAKLTTVSYYNLDEYPFVVQRHAICVRVKFGNLIEAACVEEYKLEIDDTFNVNLSSMERYGYTPCPINNQRAISRLLTEWGAE